MTEICYRRIDGPPKPQSVILLPVHGCYLFEVRSVFLIPSCMDGICFIKSAFKTTRKRAFDFPVSLNIPFLERMPRRSTMRRIVETGIPAIFAALRIVI